MIKVSLFFFFVALYRRAVACVRVFTGNPIFAYYRSESDNGNVITNFCSLSCTKCRNTGYRKSKKKYYREYKAERKYEKIRTESMTFFLGCYVNLATLRRWINSMGHYRCVKWKDVQNLNLKKMVILNIIEYFKHSGTKIWKTMSTQTELPLRDSKKMC